MMVSFKNISSLLWLCIATSWYFGAQAKSDTLTTKKTPDTLQIKTSRSFLIPPQKIAQTRSFPSLLPTSSKPRLNQTSLLHQLYQQKLQLVDSTKQQEAQKIHSLSDFVKANNLLVKSLNLAAPIQLPLGIRKTIAGTEYIVAIDSMVVDANGIATVGAYLSLTTPQGKKLAFGGTMQISAEGGLVGETRLALMVDLPLKFSKGVLLNVKSTETYVVVDCNGFKEMGLKGELTFTNLVKDSTNALPGNTPIVTSFTTTVKSWNDLVVKVDMPDFQIKGIKGLGFKVEEAIFDFSDSRNALNFKLPDNYDASWLPNANPYDATWQGIYFRSFKVALPRYLKTKNKDGTISTDTTRLRNRITFTADNIVLDATGFTGKVSIDRLIAREQGKLAGWAFSIDHLSFAFQANTLKFFKLNGQINLPIAKKGDPESYLSYKAMLDFYNDELLFGAGTNRPIKIPMFGNKSTLLLTQTYLEAKIVRGDIQPKAVLSGKFSIKNKTLNIEEIRFEGLEVTQHGVHNFNRIDARFGKKEAGQFPIQITEIGLVTKKDLIQHDSTQSFVNTQRQDEVDYLGIRMGVQINFTKALPATGYVTLISSQVQKPTGEKEWTYKNTQINGVKIDIDNGPYLFKGMLRFYQDDPVYGNGFNGNLTLGISMAGGKGFGMRATAIFGSVGGTRYWYADALVAFSPGLPIGPSGLSIYGFGGGLYYRMSKRQGGVGVNKGELGRTASGAVYLPDANAGLGLKATVVLGLSASLKPFHGDVTFEMAFNRHGGLRYVGFAGYGYFLNKKKNITVKDLVKSPEDKRKTTPLSAEVVIDYDVENKVFHLVAGVQVNIQKGAAQIKGGGQMVMHFAPDEWYVHIGTPQKRLGVDVSLVGVRLQTGLYLMTGTSVPEIPPPPAKVREILGLGEEIDARDSEKMFAGRGFAIGFDLQIKKEFNALVYLKAHIGLGFDISYKKYADNVRCKGREGQIGVNGWFGQGQAYLYIEGGLGIRFKKRNYPIAEISAALLAQVQFVNPMWAKGTLGGRFSILGGLVKGSFKLEAEVGQRCELTTNGGSGAALLSDVQVISDISPTSLNGKADVFTSPQVAFNMPVGVAFNMQDEQDNPIQFRAKLDKFKITAAGQTLAGTMKWNDTQDVLLFETEETLPEETQITVEVALLFEENKGGRWQPVLDGNQPFTEKKQENFQTGKAPPYVPLANIASSYPVINQLHLHTQEATQGFIQLHSGQSYLFDLKDSPWTAQKLRWVNPQTGQYQETPFRYDAASKRIVFDMKNAGLQQATVYQLDMVNIPKTVASSVDNNVRNDARNIVTGNDTLTFSNKKISQSKQNYQEKSLIDPQGIYFRTSKYSTLAAKFNTLRIEQGLLAYIAPYVDAMHNYIKGDELFDQAELQGVNINRGRRSYSVPPLIQIEADLPNTSWHQQGLNPIIYAGYPFGNTSQLSINWRPTPTFGVPPYKAVSLFQRATPVMLDPAQLSYPQMNAPWLRILYEVAHYADKDMRNLQTRIATANTYGMSLNSRLMKIISSRFPAMQYGDYPIKVKYIIPGKDSNSASSTNVLLQTKVRPKK